MTLTLNITLQNPLKGVWFAGQVGKASKSYIEQIQTAADQDLHFGMPVTIKGSPQTSPLPDFGGPYVQGKVGDRFVYICIGTAAGQIGSIWSRRLKIPLNSIDWNMAEKTILYTHINATAKDGSPTCGTVKPFEGWKT